MLRRMLKGMMVRTNWRNMRVATSRRGSDASPLGCWSSTRCFLSGRSITVGNIGAVLGQDDQARTICWSSAIVSPIGEFIDPENADRAWEEDGEDGCSQDCACGGGFESPLPVV